MHAFHSRIQRTIGDVEKKRNNLLLVRSIKTSRVPGFIFNYGMHCIDTLSLCITQILYQELHNFTPDPQIALLLVSSISKDVRYLKSLSIYVFDFFRQKSGLSLAD